MRTRVLISIGVMSAMAATTPVFGEEDSAALPKQYVIDLGVGGKYKPKYPGADKYILVPYPIISVSRFFVPGFGSFGKGDKGKSGFSLFPSFDFNGERKASDSSDLAGTNTIDWALEVGAGAAYRYDWFRGFVAVRQGFNGHTGQVIDMGVDVITNPTDRLSFVFGPRATWGSDDYMSTYFGVTQSEANNSAVLTQYDANAGFKSVGVIARANYAVTEKTTFHVQAGWDRLIGDAGDSPIVKLGDADQFSVGAGMSYKFEFDLFK